MRKYRLASHASIVLVAIAISGYGAADIGLSLASRPGTVDAAAVNVGDVALGRDSTIIKPIAIPSTPLPNRHVIRYAVGANDTLDSIARAHGITLREVTWSNPGLHLPLKVGQILKLPPTHGVVIFVKPGDSAATLAATYGVDATAILGFNSLRADQVTPGLTLFVPVDPQVGPNLSTGMPADPIDPGALVCPIKGAPIIQKFGPTGFELEPPYGGYLHFHTGVDILAEYGTPIGAAAGGKVTAVGFVPYFGLRVEITDSYGLVEIYAHMSAASAAVGEPVQQGQKIGLVGSTGLSIGYHLHLQLEIGGLPTDPMPLVGC
ncbi:MAG TPA: peptidoglycan DD-metalloendopeptidase family protein [Candidatus Dormibacteraeota bacterium]|nr:peptidoglycan DD-metalloendopeptidase family protein [Candidatus Dormibacteraeota bacterium]